MCLRYYLQLQNFSPRSGAVGELIKLWGTGFSMDVTENSVSFDGGTTYVVVDRFVEDVRIGVEPVDTLEVSVPLWLQTTGNLMVKVLDGMSVPSLVSFTLLSPMVE